MSTDASEGRLTMTGLLRNWLIGVRRSLMCVLLMFSAFSLVSEAHGQSLETASESGLEPTAVIAEVSVSLPGSHQMAMALATPGLRQQALLNLAVAANLLSQVEEDAELDYTVLAQQFLDDRAWLQMLVERYGWVQPRSSVLDPAAWLVLGELQKHGLESEPLVFPGRSLESVLIDQVFQRAGQRLASANLPVLLLEIEANALHLWNAFLQLTGPQDIPDAAWKVVEEAWFPGLQISQPQISKDDRQVIKPVIDNIPLAVSQWVRNTVETGPPDSMKLTRLRYSVINKMPAPADMENAGSRDFLKNSLYLVNIVDGLNDGHYFDFIQGLLSITSRLIESPVNTESTYPMVGWLVGGLPALSTHYAVDFARVDPRLNAAMAAVYDVLLNMANADESVLFDRKAARLVLADVVAQLALLIPDMGYYFDTPVRARIVKEIDQCIGIAAGLDDEGLPVMTRRQFDRCMESLLQLADRETRLTELSGDINGPFTTDTLRRELNVTPWQRINYGIGYLHERYTTACQPPANALPNPLEWSVLATTMSWFGSHFPEFFKSSENEVRLTQMRNIGEQLILGLAEQAGCLVSAGSAISDPVTRGMTDYELALRELDVGIKNAETSFRTQRLRTGADVSLELDALQRTAYRPDNLMIQPCDLQTVCEMSGDLSTTRALIGLFPDEYLIADQTGMGHIKICYRDMEWVQRRSELVRADDQNVANYFGHLGFDLVGRYVENNEASDIFGFRFTSPQEHHYLFAQTSEEVLNDSCPVEWVGSRIVTSLREKRGGIVPNRLTYLAASRKVPSRLLQNNWDRGAEWRDWFVTGIGVSALQVPASPDIKSRLNQHLQSLYQAEQADIYQRVLLQNARNAQGEDVSLFDEMSQVSIAKALIRMHMILFYPESLSNSDTIRMAVAGDSGLLEGRTLRRFREDNVALTAANGIARERLNTFRDVWSKQPEAVRKQGSIPASLMHAMTRINSLYRQSLISLPETLHESETDAQVGEQDAL